MVNDAHDGPNGPGGFSVGQAAPFASNALNDILSGADAEAMLVEGLLGHMLKMDEQAIRAAVFMMHFGMAEELAFILKMKAHQESPRQLAQALDAVSLKKFLGKMDIVLGNK